MPTDYQPDHSDIMDLLHEAFVDYIGGSISDTEYIARVNVCLSAEHQRRERAKDPEGYDATMLNRAIELGLVPVNSTNQ